MAFQEYENEDVFGIEEEMAGDMPVEETVEEMEEEKDEMSIEDKLINIRRMLEEGNVDQAIAKIDECLDKMAAGEEATSVEVKVETAPEDEMKEKMMEALGDKTE